MSFKTFVAGEILTASDTNTFLANNGFQLREIIYFTSNGTFSKATYPWLKAIRVRCQAGGGAGGGAVATSGGQFSVGGGGGGGSYAESFITDIASLPSSVTVTRGAGGTGVSGDGGNAGGASSFGSLVVTQGGDRALASIATTSPIFGPSAIARSGGTGDVIFGGSAGTNGLAFATGTGRVRGGNGGDSHLGGGAGALSQQAGVNGTLHGSGGGGARSLDGEGAAAGGSGANGIVILELFA